MAQSITRLLPFRDYSEHEVINLFSLDTASGEAGTLVKVLAGNLDLDPVNYVDRSTANGGWASYTHATSQYPVVPLKVTKATATDTGNILGIMLRDVREVDENGEKLMFYPIKKAELQCVSSGEVVPIARRGTFTYLARGFTNSVVPAPGSILLPGAAGTVTGVAPTAATAAQRDLSVGVVLATGFRESQQDTDALAGAYAMLTLSL